MNLAIQSATIKWQEGRGEGRKGEGLFRILSSERWRVLDACSCSVDYLDKSGPKFGSVEWFCTRGGGIWMFGIDVWDEFWPELGPFR